jgi:hypothetical protein
MTTDLYPATTQSFCLFSNKMTRMISKGVPTNFASPHLYRRPDNSTL